MTRVVAFVPDLMDRSRISAAAPGVTFVSSPGALVVEAADVDVVVVDLSRPGVLDVVASLDARVIGFASHVDRHTIAAAESAGCDEVLPRSQFFRRVGDLLGGDPV